MTKRQDLEQFLQQQGIQYELPTNIANDASIYDAMLEVCQQLVRTIPPLLSPSYKENLITLIKVAQDPIFFSSSYNGAHRSTRPIIFKHAINNLFDRPKILLEQDTFDAVCQIATANIDQNDILEVTVCFAFMDQLNLLNQKNIKTVITNTLQAPLRLNSAAALLPNHDGQSSETLTFTDLGYLEDLQYFLAKGSWIRQEDFDFVMQSKLPLRRLTDYICKLHDLKLNNPTNYQALADSEIDTYELATEVNFDNQEQFNQWILGKCDVKLDSFYRRIDRWRNFCAGEEGNTQFETARTIYRSIEALVQKLTQIRNTPETIKDPRPFLRKLIVIFDALPHPDYKTPKATISDLIAFASELKKDDFSIWKEVGTILMVLATAAALAAGIILSFGITPPLGICIAKVGAASVATGLIGLGLFACAGTKNGLADNLLELAEAVQKTP